MRYYKARIIVYWLPSKHDCLDRARPVCEVREEVRDLFAVAVRDQELVVHMEIPSSLSIFSHCLEHVL
jgi:hypothetical protein